MNRDYHISMIPNYVDRVKTHVLNRTKEQADAQNLYHAWLQDSVRQLEIKLCIASEWGLTPVSQIEEHSCQSIIPTAHPYVVTSQKCELTIDRCTPSPTGTCKPAVPNCKKTKQPR